MDNKKHSDDRFDDASGDKALWDLLGSARKVEPNPMFARNVLREIRKESETSRGFAGWFQSILRPAVLVGAVAVLIFAGISALQMQTPEVVETDSDPIEELDFMDPAEEFESIERLGELMAVSDPGTLSDEAFMNLLF